MARMMILDGNSLVNRAFYALPPLTSAEGLPTNAVHGFLTMLFRLQKEQKPDYWVVVFDKTKPTVRINQYAEYKAQRKPTPDTLRPQFSYLKEILQIMQVPILELEGYEADDIIAAAADKGWEQGMEVSIYTGDKDALQLINPLTRIYLTVRGISDVKCYDEERLAEEYGLKPQQIIDLKGLAGDVSDNIPGVPGIGQKTALKLLHEYGTVENVLKQKENVRGDKIKKLLADYADQALLSKKLAALIHDVPLEFSLDDLVRREPDLAECKAVLHSYSLYKIAQLFEQTYAYKKEEPSVLPADKPAEPEEDFATDVIIPDGSGWIRQMNAWQEEKAVLSLGYRYEGDCVHRGKWTEMGISDGKNSYLLERENQPAVVLEKWYELLADEAVRKIVADSKTLRVLLLNEQKILDGMDVDLSLAAYLLNPSLSAYRATDLLREHGSGLLGFPVSREAALLRRIAPAYVERIAREKLEKLLYEVEEPLSRVLALMENQGITADKELLTQFGSELEEKIHRLEGEIYELAGSRFNLNSPQQLGKVLFEDLRLPPMKKNKTGYSTDAETLEELRREHPVIDKLLQYRQLVKLNSTYVKGLLNQLYDGKIRTTFQQTVTATGRLSSTEPNLQNIPIRLEEGRKLRQVFKPSKQGWVLLSADYSQIELRVLAHYSRDPLLCESFIAGEDVHARTASEVFGVPLEEVTADMRRKAKAVNFGLMYGLTDFGLARDLSIARKEAKYYIEQYFKRYSGVRRYLEEAVQSAKNTGEVRTLFNRLRKIPELSHPNRMTRQFGERIAKNTPIQGTAADIMKIAMIKAAGVLQDLQADILLQVHDELLIQTAAQELPGAASKVKKAMEQACHLSVPLVVDCKVGRNWYEMVPYMENNG